MIPIMNTFKELAWLLILINAVCEIGLEITSNLIKGIEDFPVRSKCATNLFALNDDELVAYDEYLNCMINSYMFRRFLSQSARFTEGD